MGTLFGVCELFSLLGAIPLMFTGAAMGACAPAEAFHQLLGVSGTDLEKVSPVFNYKNVIPSEC